MYPPLIQTLAASVPPPAQCQQSDFEVKPQFSLSLWASPCCLHNVGQSIITQPTYLLGLLTALAIHPWPFLQSLTYPLENSSLPLIIYQ